MHHRRIIIAHNDCVEGYDLEAHNTHNNPQDPCHSDEDHLHVDDEGSDFEPALGSECQTLLDHEDTDFGFSQAENDTNGAQPGSLSTPPACTASDLDCGDYEDEINLEDDPLFLSREAAFLDPPEISGDADIGFHDEAMVDDELPPAFSESPLIRNIYITAFLLSSYHHASHEAIKLFLNSHHQSLLSIHQHTGLEIPGLDSMARTLPTVEKRLRIDPGQYIVYHFVCNQCWFRHHPADLYALGSSTCVQDNCEGTLYIEKEMANNSIKRIPVKLLPTVPLIPMLQRFLLRSGKHAEYQHWRQPGDEPGAVAPNPEPEHIEDVHMCMYDIYDGWGWRAIQAGLERCRGGEWEVEDVDVHGIHQRFVSLPCGLVFVLNIDW